MGARGVWLGVLLTYPDLLLSSLRIFYLLFYDCITGYLPYFHQHWLHQPGEKPLHQQPTTTTTSEQQFIGSRLVLLFVNGHQQFFPLPRCDIRGPVW